VLALDASRAALLLALTVLLLVLVWRGARPAPTTDDDEIAALWRMRSFMATTTAQEVTSRGSMVARSHGMAVWELVWGVGHGENVMANACELTRPVRRPSDRWGTTRLTRLLTPRDDDRLRVDLHAPHIAICMSPVHLFTLYLATYYM